MRLLQKMCYQVSYNSGWHHDEDGNLIDAEKTVPLDLVLIHSEISEALEGHRKNLMDSYLPHRKAIEVELADAMIRILDMSESLGFDMETTIQEKLIYNANRADHKKENRNKPNGKKY